MHARGFPFSIKPPLWAAATSVLDSFQGGCLIQGQSGCWYRTRKQQQRAVQVSYLAGAG